MGRITIHHSLLLSPFRANESVYLFAFSFYDVQCHDNEGVAMERRNHVATTVVMRWMEERMVISIWRRAGWVNVLKVLQNLTPVRWFCGIAFSPSPSKLLACIMPSNVTYVVASRHCLSLALLCVFSIMVL